MRSVARTALWTLGLAAGVLATASGARAEPTIFDLPSEDAAQAILDFARQAGLQIIAPADQLKGVKTPAIKGKQDARAALSRLLAGTGLVIAADNGTVITLRWSGPPAEKPKASPAQAKPQAARLQARESTVIKDMVVTATKTGATKSQRTPIDVDVVSGGDLLDENIKNIKDLWKNSPELEVSTNNANPQIYIRGVGGYNGGESDVSVYLDGVYLARLSVLLQTDFNDLDRIEIIEGPQGTLFGRNSTGGAINLVSKLPSDHFTFTDTVQAGNFSLLDETFAISGPLAANLQARLSFSHVQHDGYLHNVDPGVGDPGAADRTGVRGQLRWEPSADIVNTLRADYAYTHERWATNDTFLSPTVGVTWSDPLLASINGQFADVDVNSIPYENELALGVSDGVTWTIDNGLILKSLTAARTDDSYLSQDSLTDVNYSYGYTHYNEYQLSQELNLIQKKGPITGVVGLYIFQDHVRFQGFSYNPGGNLKIPDPDLGNLSHQDTLQPTMATAAFFDETFHLTPTFDVIVGARYTREHKTLDTDNATIVYAPGYANDGAFTAPPAGAVNPFIADLNKDADALTPKFGVQWQAAPQALVYASATNGYKSGGYNGTARAAQGADFGPEKIWAYEIGAKTDWLDNSLRLNLSAFHYDWTDLQFNASIAPQVSVVSNAASAKLDGLEADILAKPTAGLTLTADMTLLRSDYVEFRNFAFQAGLKPFLAGNPRYNAATGAYNASGDQLVNAPAVSVNLSAQKDFVLFRGGDLFVRAEYQFTSRTYFDPTNAAIASRPAISLVNASVGYSPPRSHWEASLWGKNLGDAAYINGFGGGAFDTAPVGDPRTFGVRLKYMY